MLLSVVSLVLRGAVQGSDNPGPSDVAIGPYKYNLFRWGVDHFLDKWVNKFQDILPWNSEPPRERRIGQAQEFFDLRSQIRDLERELADRNGPADIHERIDGLQRLVDDLQPDVEETIDLSPHELIKQIIDDEKKTLSLLEDVEKLIQKEIPK